MTNEEKKIHEETVSGQKALSDLIDMPLDDFRVLCVRDTLGVCMSLKNLLNLIYGQVNTIRLQLRSLLERKEGDTQRIEAIHAGVMNKMMAIEHKIICLNAVIDIKRLPPADISSQKSMLQ